MQTERTKVICDEIRESRFRNDRKQAMLRQTVTRHYEGGWVENDLQDNIFNKKDFNFGEGNTYKEHRVAFIDVPVDATVEQVQKLLDANPNCCLYRILSNEPILTENQKAAVRNQLVTLEQIKERQLVPKRTDDGDIVVDGHGNPVPQTWNGQRQYRRTFFSLTAKKDIDKREQSVLGAETPTKVVPRTEAAPANASEEWKAVEKENAPAEEDAQ